MAKSGYVIPSGPGDEELLFFMHNFLNVSRLDWCKVERCLCPIGDKWEPTEGVYDQRLCDTVFTWVKYVCLRQIKCRIDFFIAKLSFTDRFSLYITTNVLLYIVLKS